LKKIGSVVEFQSDTSALMTIAKRKIIAIIKAIEEMHKYMLSMRDIFFSSIL